MMGTFDWDDFVCNLAKDTEYIISPIRDVFTSGGGWGPDVTLREGERYKAKFLRVDNSMSLTFVMLQPSEKEGDCQTFGFSEICIYLPSGQEIKVDMFAIDVYQQDLIEKKDRNMIVYHEAEIAKLKMNHGW